MELKRIVKQSDGQVLVLAALTLVVVIGVGALAIDLGMAYAIKAKLSSAVDAASLAAGKAIKIGASDTQRRQNATDAANSFFVANFPAGVMGSTDPVFRVDSITSSAGTWTVNVSATARAPIFFGGMFNLPISVGASAETTIKTVDLMLVLDCSGSLGGAIVALRQAAIDFVNGFQEGAGGDRVGLVTFASGAVLNDPIDKSATRGFVKSSLTSHLAASSSAGATNAEEAMRIAKTELDLIPSELRSTLRAIVFFSDGAPNIVSGRFTLRDLTITPPVGLYSVLANLDNPADYYTIDSRTSTVQCYKRNSTYTNILACGPGYGYTYISTLPATDYTGTVNLASFNGARTLSGSPVTNTWCNLNKASRNMVENIANAARGGEGNSALTIYTIGLGAQLDANEVTNCGYDQSEYGASIMKRLANTTDSDRYQPSQPTGIYVWAADQSQLNSAFQRIRSAVLRLSR